MTAASDPLILADENIELPIVKWLRAQGVNVSWIAELAPSLPDDEVLGLARVQKRILVTGDKDFGELIVRQRRAAHGVVLLRISAASASDRVRTFVRSWETIRDRAAGHYLIVSDRSIRVRPLQEP